MVFDLHYLQTQDEALFSYGRTGSGEGLPLVFLSMFRLGFQERLDVSGEFFGRLGRDRAVCYPEFWFTPEALTRDPEAAWNTFTEDVIEAANACGFDRFAVVTTSRAVPAGLRVAAEASGKVACLVVWSGTAVAQPRDPTAPQRALRGMMSVDWETFTDNAGMLYAGRSNPETAAQVAATLRELFSSEL